MKYKNLLLLIIFNFYFITASSITWSLEAKKWTEHKSEHFIIYYRTAPKDFVKTVEKSAEIYYKEITRNLGFNRFHSWTWDRRAKIYIYDDKEDYHQSGKFEWSHGVAFSRAKVIETYPSAHGFFDTILPHEIGHIIFREFVGFRARIPTWFEEGVAMNQEKAKRWGADKVVAKAIADETFIPLTDLSQVHLNRFTSKDTVKLFYAESASIVSFMINKGGKHKFVRFCRKLKDGDPFEWVFEKVYLQYRSIERLNKSWVKYLQDQ
ncbi:MAG: hypothetical protein K8S27_02175 [Candidatus Omnitrophica bacterium]|nr:hypothetical protein [Candidatus Omnitrophota bacterium]